MVSLHAAVTPESVGLFGEEQFSWMRPGSVFLNTARAELHDMGALVARFIVRAPWRRRS